MLFDRWRRRRLESEVAGHLYEIAVDQARRPAFYSAYQVPDNLDGRFELIALHVFLLLHRLKASYPETRDLAQALHDRFFADMDRSLREMGAGDLGVGKRVKRMAEGFYGRIPAYEAALADDTVAADALRRNLYGTLPDVDPARLAAIAAYLRAQAAALASQETASFLAGRAEFLPVTDSLPPSAANPV